MPTTSATTVAMASDTSVTCRGSTSGVPPTAACFNHQLPSSVTAGMVSAGMNNRLPQRCALASRSARGALSRVPCPSLSTLATSTIAITSSPVTTCGRRLLAKNVTAYNPQNSALLHRRGFVASRAFTIATPSVSSPMSQYTSSSPIMAPSP
jgi:hypothetical protein